MDNSEYNKIKFAIRNMKLLTQEQINSINKMDENQKEDIILIYNNVVASLIHYIEIHNI